jgi:hypothetical protein
MGELTLIINKLIEAQKGLLRNEDIPFKERQNIHFKLCDIVTDLSEIKERWKELNKENGEVDLSKDEVKS